MRLFGNTTKKANDKDNAKIKMVEVSQLRFDRDFKNVFQQILNRECVKKKAGETCCERRNCIERKDFTEIWDCVAIRCS